MQIVTFGQKKGLKTQGDYPVYLPQTKVIETPSSEAFYNQRLLYIKIKSGARIDINEAKRQFGEWSKIQHGLTLGQTYGMIIDIRQMSSVSSEARMHYARSNDEKGVALAMIVESMITVYTANFLMNFNRDKGRIRMFGDERKALDWVNSLVLLHDAMQKKTGEIE